MSISTNYNWWGSRHFIENISDRIFSLWEGCWELSKWGCWFRNFSARWSCWKISEITWNGQIKLQISSVSAKELCLRIFNEGDCSVTGFLGIIFCGCPVIVWQFEWCLKRLYCLSEHKESSISSNELAEWDEAIISPSCLPSCSAFELNDESDPKVELFLIFELDWN